MRHLVLVSIYFPTILPRWVISVEIGEWRVLPPTFFTPPRSTARAHVSLSPQAPPRAQEWLDIQSRVAAGVRNVETMGMSLDRAHSKALEGSRQRKLVCATLIDKGENIRCA